MSWPQAEKGRQEELGFLRFDLQGTERYPERHETRQACAACLALEVGERTITKLLYNLTVSIASKAIGGSRSTSRPPELRSYTK